MLSSTNFIWPILEYLDLFADLPAAAKSLILMEWNQT